MTGHLLQLAENLGAEVINSPRTKAILALLYNELHSPQCLEAIQILLAPFCTDPKTGPVVEAALHVIEQKLAPTVEQPVGTTVATTDAAS